MARKSNQPDWNIEDLTDAEISAAIHYLELDSMGKSGDGSDSDIRRICLTLIFIFLEWAVFILLYYHIA